MNKVYSATKWQQLVCDKSCLYLPAMLPVEMTGTRHSKHSMNQTKTISDYIV